MDKVAFLINRTIRRYDNLLGEFEYRFKDLNCSFFTSAYARHIEELAKEAVHSGHRSIVAVGGDGTMNELINGVCSAFRNEAGDIDWEGLKSIRIGLYPGGSGNDFARHLGLKPNIKRMHELLKDGSTRPVDIGRATFTGKNGRPAERFYINITDVGMGGATVQHMEKHRIPMIGSNLNYMKAIMSSFISYKKSTVRWQAGEQSWEGLVMSLVVANGKFFGSGLGIAPDAEIDDGKFSLVTLADITMMDYIRNMRQVKACRKIDHPAVYYNTVEKVTIESAEGKELPIDMDGDFVGYCPMTIACIPAAISFLV